MLSLSDFLYNLLLSRQNQSATKFVFSDNGKMGYVVELRKIMKKVINPSGVRFALYDL